MLYLERKRLAAITAAEAAGEDVWTEDVSKVVRTKLAALWSHLPNRYLYVQHIQAVVHNVMLLEAGVENASTDIDMILRTGHVDLALSYLEMIARGLREKDKEFLPRGKLHETWVRGVSSIFEAHRLKFKFIEGEITPLDSEIMHAQVVEPTLVLLHGKQEFAKSERSFREALEELAGGKPDDAITDAGRALQEALTAVGCKGNTLGELTKDAKNNGWFGPRDSLLADSIAKIHNWVAAERNAGEAHRVSDATKDDAWFVVHVVGAAIVRLAAGPRATA